MLTPMSGVQFSHNLLTRSIADPADGACHVRPARFDRRPQSTPANAATPAGVPTDLARTVQRVLPFMSAGSPAVDGRSGVDRRAAVRQHRRDPQVVGDVLPERASCTDVRASRGNADIETEGRGSDAVIEAWAERSIDGATVTATGAPALLKDINDYLRGGIVKLGALAIVGMALILLLGFRVRWRLLSLGVVLVGVVWAFGLAGYLGIPLSIVTIAALPVMLGIGIDFALQLHARVEEEVVVDRRPSIRRPRVTSARRCWW